MNRIVHLCAARCGARVNPTSGLPEGCLCQPCWEKWKRSGLPDSNAQIWLGEQHVLNSGVDYDI